VAKNLTNLELDFVDDLNGTMKLASQNENIVGKCKVGSIEDLSAKDYALVFMTKHGEDKRYPMKTRDQALLSCWYLEKNASKIPLEVTKVAASHLKRACGGHKIPVSDFIEKHNSDDVDSNVVNPYMDSESGKFACDNKYPINTPEQIKIAVEYFEEHEKRFDPDHAFEFCNNVHDAASSFGLKIASEKKIMGYIPDGYSNFLKLAFDNRLSLMSGIYEYGDKDGDAIKLSYNRLYNSRDDMKPIEFSKKLAHVDKIAGIDAHWDKGTIENPFKSTFRKISSSMVKVGGRSYSVPQLAKVAESEKFASVFSTDFVEAFKGSPEDVFNSLPLPEKKLIASIIEG